jgi:lipoprotein-anchoring transpeptidase ErfK/SrfK
MAASLAALVAGTTALAVQATGGSTPGAASPVTRAARHTSSHKAADTAAPVTIPPAPSTTNAGAAPGAGPAGSDAAGSGTGSGYGGPVPHWVRSVAPATINGAPTNVNDPSVVATATVRTLPLYNSPNAPTPSRTLANPNNLGAALTLLVTGYQAGWVQAYIPVRPNETTAWMPADDVSISFVTTHIVVNLTARQLTLYRDNAPVFQTPVAPGAPSSPTPTGSFFVAYIVKLTDPGGPYGPFALGTSAFSNTYFSFEGGPGQVGIHGTDQPWVIGSYASHGCVRLPNSAITTVATQILPGTPVEITR